MPFCIAALFTYAYVSLNSVTVVEIVFFLFFSLGRGVPSSHFKLPFAVFPFQPHSLLSQQSLHCRQSSSPGSCGSTPIANRSTSSWMGFVTGLNLASPIPNGLNQPRRTSHQPTNTLRLLMSIWAMKCPGAGWRARLTPLPYPTSK